MPLTYNRRRRFFASTKKTMKQLLNEGDTTYVGTLYNFLPILIYQQSSKLPIKTPYIITTVKENKSKSTSAFIV